MSINIMFSRDIRLSYCGIVAGCRVEDNLSITYGAKSSSRRANKFGRNHVVCSVAGVYLSRTAYRIVVDILKGQSGSGYRTFSSTSVSGEVIAVKNRFCENDTGRI